MDGAKGGEEILAFVQTAPNSALTDAELADYAAAHLAPYKRPSQIRFVTAIPLTPTGKIVKAELAKLAEFSLTR